MRCAILCRKSNPQEATGDEKSVALQERECRALIERNGWELADGPRNRTGTSRPQPGRGQGCIGIGTADGRARRTRSGSRSLRPEIVSYALRPGRIHVVERLLNGDTLLHQAGTTPLRQALGKRLLVLLLQPTPSNDVQHLAEEAGRLFGLYHEQVDRLQTEQAQENERLRADLGRLDALQAENRTEQPRQ
jgi:hypothetical protein